MMAESSVDANFLRRMAYTLAIKKPAMCAGAFSSLFGLIQQKDKVVLVTYKKQHEEITNSRTGTASA